MSAMNCYISTVNLHLGSDKSLHGALIGKYIKLAIILYHRTNVCGQLFCSWYDSFVSSPRQRQNQIRGSRFTFGGSSAQGCHLDVCNFIAALLEVVLGVLLCASQSGVLLFLKALSRTCSIALVRWCKLKCARSIRIQSWFRSTSMKPFLCGKKSCKTNAMRFK